MCRHQYRGDDSAPREGIENSPTKFIGTLSEWVKQNCMQLLSVTYILFCQDNWNFVICAKLDNKNQNDQQLFFGDNL